MIRSLKNSIWRALYGDGDNPVLGEKPFGGPDESNLTFVVVVRKGFNINIPNANSAIRLGYCMGFAQLGIRYRIISVHEIEKEIENIPNPVIFLSVYDYTDLRRSFIKKLRNYTHIVWGSPNYGLLKKVYGKFNYSYTEDLGRDIFGRVSYSHPAFVWAPVPPSALCNYTDWQKHGCRIESIPLACDTTRYFPTGQIPFEQMNDIVFVGGYWEKKAIQFDKYLKPFENRLTIYGYSQWPYSGYRGLLPEEKEKELYCNAKAAPALSEPHAEYTGDIVERVFKIMGCRGLAVPDVNRYYAELFTSDELFVPASPKEYHEFINEALHNKEMNYNCRERGFNAVMKKHTYTERAKQILNLLNISY
jgi:glycosyltransferase involved in cell wall biosynthesis